MKLKISRKKLAAGAFALIYLAIAAIIIQACVTRYDDTDKDIVGDARPKYIQDTADAGADDVADAADADSGAGAGAQAVNFLLDIMRMLIPTAIMMASVSLAFLAISRLMRHSIRGY